jgi:hypothetical protein
VNTATTISEEEHEVVLHEERPVAQTETEAVERVRPGTETVSGDETVGGAVRREEIEMEAEGQPIRDVRRGTS